MSLIEEVMRRQAHERGATPAIAASATGTASIARSAPTARAARPAVVPVQESTVQQYRPAPVDAEALERNRVLLRVQDVAVSRAYKILRTRVLHRMADHDWTTLGVTGTGAGEGKTVTAINLAIALAQDPNIWVYLVDLDLQRPQLGAYLGMTYDHGLTDFLGGQAELDQIIYDIGLKRLAVVPNASPVETSSEYLRSARMADFINALEAQTPRRIIVLDMPPIMMSDDVLAFAPRVDSFLLVASQGLTARRTLANAKEVLAELNLLGVVLNRSTERNDSPYY
ncbi:MAG TPA: CpsD/CapB family tyrosine-protein kinase [Steroidobacteraceae bacterium]|jgi:capsular exopolysaccharide synthesis family protein|nr:CpsD/CapB family tyrosine-protein kinase [Steroidobacteraceae bacterium]